MEIADVLNKPLYVVGNASTVLEMSKTYPMQPFADIVIDFLNALSKNLMRGKSGFSDVATFAFWCRKAHILSEKARC